MNRILCCLCLACPFLAAPLNAAEVPFEKGHWVDLTHDFSAQTLYWPTASNFVLVTEFHGQTPNGYFYEANRFSASEHGGTHIDAPVHFAENHASVDQLPVEQLVGRAVVIDISTKSRSQADYQVTTEDFTNWEKKNGRIPKEAIVLLKTGFAHHWPDAQKYLGTAEKGPGAVAKLHFPGLHPDTARWLVKERPVRAIGLDTASIDFGQSTLFESHRILFEKNIPALENIANLDALPAKGAFVIALPMKIKDGSGAPLRIVAWLPGK